VLYDALVSVVLGRATVTTTRARVPAPRAHTVEDWPAGPAYEVMFLIDSQDDAIPGLKTALGGLGDSLLVVGGDGLWNVHVHVDDVGAAIEAGVEAGRPHRIRVTHFADAVARREAEHELGQRGLVSVVAGDGLAALLETAGATVVRGGPGRRASTAELLDGIQRARAREVVVLPNDADSLSVAEAAAAQARTEGLRVAVIPTTASVQALAAAAVHEPGRRFDEDVVHMTAAALHTRHGGVTVAAREAMTMAGPCQPGDVLGIVGGDFAVIGDDLAKTACDVVDRMLGGGGELVTLVTGADAPSGLADEVAAHIARTRPEVDAVMYDGGQPRYPLLIGVE
jgi:dihydroxyacetone kinase-like predicted kinase